MADIAKSKQSNQNEIQSSKEPSIRFKNGIPMHSDVDLSASCPRCLAAAAEKPNGSDGELDLYCAFVFLILIIFFFFHIAHILPCGFLLLNR